MKKNMSLHEFDDRYIEIRIKRNRVLVGDCTDGSYSTIGQFKGEMSNQPYRDSVTFLGYDGSLTTQKTNIVQAWRKLPDRIIATDIVHQPILPPEIESNRVIVSDNRVYFNAYNAPNFELVNDSNHVNKFVAFIQSLVGKHTEWVLDWISHMIQRPNESPGVAPIFIYRNDSDDVHFLIYELIAPMIGFANVSTYLNLNQLKLSIPLGEFDPILTNFNINGYEPKSRINSMKNLIVGDSMRQKKQQGFTAPYARYILKACYKDKTATYEQLDCIKRIDVILCTSKLVARSELEDLVSDRDFRNQIYSFLFRRSFGVRGLDTVIYGTI